MVNPHKTVLMIMVDALRHDYINEQDSPFLYKLANGGTSGSLMPSFGFEPDAAYFSGLDPEECEGGTQYWRNPNETVFRFVPLFRLFHYIPSRWWRKNLRKAIRLVAQLAARDPLTRQLAPCNQIPLEILPQFSFPMKMNACDAGFTQSPTVFDVVRNNGGKFFYHGHPSFKVKIDNVVSRYISSEDGSNDLAFLFIADLDGIGHKFGPDSKERKAALRRVDTGLQKIYETAKQRYSQVDMLVFGDHGMAAVNRHIDLGDVLNEANLDMNEDCYFLDSTFARFWISDSERRVRLIALLNKLDGGHVLSRQEVEKYRIRHPHNYFGDIIFAVDDHAIIHPSFYNIEGDQVKGMHGYLPGCKDNESAFVLYTENPGQGDIGRVDMRRIFPTIIQLLGLKGDYSIPHDLVSILA